MILNSFRNNNTINYKISINFGINLKEKLIVIPEGKNYVSFDKIQGSLTYVTSSIQRAISVDLNWREADSSHIFSTL